MTQENINSIIASGSKIKDPIMVINPLDAAIVLMLNFDPKIELHCYREMPRGRITFMSKENWEHNKRLNNGKGEI